MTAATVSLLRPGERVAVAGQLCGFATFLSAFGDGYAFVQFPGEFEPTPVATSFLTRVDALAVTR
jgi:hypothetical protein